MQSRYFESDSGRFRELPPRDDAEEIARLEALGYLGGTREPPPVSGITVHDRARAWPGLNFYTSGDGPVAVLMDMDGVVLHRWRKGFLEVWPDEVAASEQLGAKHWRRAYLYPDGAVVAIFEGQGIIKVDSDSRLVWSNRSSRAHHDLEVMSNGDIYVLGRKARQIPDLSDIRPILEEFVIVLGPDGREKRRVSLIECWRNAPEYDHIWRDRASRGGDVFHTNTLEVLDGGAEHLVPAFARGNVLISSKNTHAIAVVDLERSRVVWAHVGSYRDQHDPTVTEDLNLLLFDNRGRVGRSAVLEYRLPDMQLVWSYPGSERRQFYSHTCGASQRLPNGNTLITETDGGRAFEVTRDGDTVWEFVNPTRAGDGQQYIATVAEMQRLPADAMSDWLIGSRPVRLPDEPSQLEHMVGLTVRCVRIGLSTVGLRP